MSSYGTSKKEGSELGSQSQKKDAKLINLPGVSYIPDKLEIAEHPDLVQKVEAEFVDFLACLKDILKILYTLKTKHLRAMTPMPHEVLREIKIEKGPLFKAYDKALGGHITGISLSADTLFKRGMSVASSITRFKSANARKKASMVKKRPLESDLIEITGKKMKPLWHTVALERPVEALYDPMMNYENDDEEGPPYPPMRVLAQKDLPLSRTHSEEIISAIKYLNTTSVKPSNKIFQDQQDMLAASDAGFHSVEEYKHYLNTLKPHWFKDLVKDAVNVGIVTSKELVDCFEKLGQYYDMDSQTVPLAKSKLCYLVMSFPIWDIGRMHMQMAFNFILHDILKIPRNQEVLREWLNHRQIPYVAFAPIRSEDLFLAELKKEDEVKAKKCFLMGDQSAGKDK